MESDQLKTTETIKELALEEAHKLLENINNGISKTRDKSWQLMAVVIAINAYFITHLIEEDYTSGLVFLTLISLPCSGYIFYTLHSSLQPSGLRIAGSPPKTLKTIMVKGDEHFFNSLYNTYQISIDNNGKILVSLTAAYKKSLKTLIIFIFGSVLLYLFWLFLVESLKCYPCVFRCLRF